MTTTPASLAEQALVDGPTPAYRDSASHHRGRLQSTLRLAEDRRRRLLLLIDSLQEDLAKTQRDIDNARGLLAVAGGEVGRG